MWKVATKVVAPAIQKLKFYEGASEGMKSVMRIGTIALVIIIGSFIGFAIVDGAFKGLAGSSRTTAEKVDQGDFGGIKSAPSRTRKAASAAAALADDRYEQDIVRLEGKWLNTNMSKQQMRLWSKGKKGLFKRNRKATEKARKQVGKGFGWEDGQIVGASVRRQQIAAREAAARAASSSAGSYRDDGSFFSGNSWFS